MILAFDSYYYENKAKTVCLEFENWTDSNPTNIYTEILEDVEPYESGAFYKRELPCIISLLKKVKIELPAVIIVDSFVVLDDSGKKGLGAYLYDHLDKQIPIIGVAKTNFAQNKFNKKEILRGTSLKPLFITALGVDLKDAAEKIAKMDGQYRMPTLLQKLDTITKNIEE